MSMSPQQQRIPDSSNGGCIVKSSWVKDYLLGCGPGNWWKMSLWQLMKGREATVRRILEALLRYPLQLLILFALCPIAGIAVVYLTVPKTYHATAILWATHKYDELTATSLDTNDLSTPAETQVTALSELVQTRSFSLTVAREANLVVTLKAQIRDNPQSRDDALVMAISQYVQIQASGYNLFTITYTSTNPQVAQRVVAAIIDNYGQQSQNIAAPGEQNLLGAYQSEFSQAYTNTQKAVTAESQYIQSHPELTQSKLQNNPRYQQLYAQMQHAQLNLQKIQDSIAAVEQDIITHRIIATSLYKVLDTPTVEPVSRLKILFLGAGAGLAIGVVGSALFIALVIRRDRRVYTSEDLQKVIAYPVVMELPRLSPKTVPILIKTSGDILQ